MKPNLRIHLYDGKYEVKVSCKSCEWYRKTRNSESPNRLRSILQKLTEHEREAHNEHSEQLQNELALFAKHLELLQQIASNTEIYEETAQEKSWNSGA